MGLQGDQRALLQLLVERGQSYEDIAGLLGGTPEEVRERARGALTEIGGADPDAEVGLTDFLLGQADPIGRADAIRHLQSDPETLDLARKIQTGIAVIAPEADQPSLPEPRTKRRKAALPDSSSGPVAAAGPTEPADHEAAAAARRRNAILAGLVAVGLLLVVGVLALAGVFSGGDSGSSDSADTSTTTADSNITTVPLKPIGGSGVAGKAVFGLVSNEQLYVDVDVQGLDPNLDPSKSYLLWLMVGDSAGYPIDKLDADANGGFSGRLSVPTPIAVAVGNQAQSVRVSSTSISDLQAEIKQATKQKVPILPFTGDQLATGDIPLVDNGGSTANQSGK
jgi:hypothetical protein